MLLLDEATSALDTESEKAGTILLNQYSFNNSHAFSIEFMSNNDLIQPQTKYIAESGSFSQLDGSFQIT